MILPCKTFFVTASAFGGSPKLTEVKVDATGAVFAYNFGKKEFTTAHALPAKLQEAARAAEDLATLSF